jgi:hypothetical protein
MEAGQRPWTAARDKDESDLANTLPTLSPAERSWLVHGIALAHPGHRWLPEIGG